MKTTYRITQSGGWYYTYLRAQPSTTLSGSGMLPGNFYAVQLAVPIFNNGQCTATVNIVESVNSVITPKLGQATNCWDGMSLRVLVKTNAVFVWIDGVRGAVTSWVYTTAAAAGNPGLEVAGAPAGNGITKIEIFPCDRIAPPVPGAPGITAFDTKVEMQWPGFTDDANGAGFNLGQVWRRDKASATGTPFSYLGSFFFGTFVDLTVQSGHTYVYQIWNVDYHLNISMREITVAAAPAGTTDPRQIGVKSTGTYWGAAGEQIDVQTGNVNFTLPLVTAKTRGGMSATFSLNYNSQNWRKDAGGSWKLGRDVGYGFGWRVQAGSITLIYKDVYTVGLYIFTDSTGAEYRLTNNWFGLWTSADGTYVSFDSASRKLWFNDGTFWQMGCESAGTEDDSGTLYPTLMQDSNGNQIKLTYQPGRTGMATPAQEFSLSRIC